MKALGILTDAEAFGLGARRITVSTVGLVPAMYRFADEGMQVGLAVSLHSPNDELRRRLVPTARFSPVEILAAADYYAAKSSRRYSVEYALIEGVNDDVAMARDLARLLRGRNCHVNLIPLNPTANGETRRSSRGRVLAFERALQEAGINATVRVERGIDIAAGCGQLRGAEEGRHAVAHATPA
jgi:23S rRNA (adenine2503-C2)-methyltransferase